MADFTIDVSRSKTSRINLGIQGENIIEHIIFNISSWIEEFGEGDAYVYAQRKGDENPYPVALDMDLDAGTATWTLNATDTAVKGRGKAQLVYVVDEDGTEAITDDEIKKTRVFATTVQTSLVPASSENPDAYETWLEVLGGYTARIEAAEDDLKEWVTAQINAIDFPVSDVINPVDESSLVENGVVVLPIAGDQDTSGYGMVWADYDEETHIIGLGFIGADEVYLPQLVNHGTGIWHIRTENLPDATTTDKGAMSAADKAKLDGIVPHVVGAYGVGDYPGGGWLSDEPNGDPITPAPNTLYVYLGDDYSSFSLYPFPTFVWDETGEEYKKIANGGFYTDLEAFGRSSGSSGLTISAGSMETVTLNAQTYFANKSLRYEGIAGWEFRDNGTSNIAPIIPVHISPVFEPSGSPMKQITVTLLNPTSSSVTIGIAKVYAIVHLAEDPS